MKPASTLALVAGIIKEHKAQRIDDADALEAVRALVGIGTSLVGTASAACGWESAPLPRPASSVQPLSEIRKAVGASKAREPGWMQPPGTAIDVDQPDAAMEAVMGPQLEDYRRGRMDHETVLQVAEIRGPQIQQMRGAERKPPQPCAECGAPSTTTIGGVPYCDAHAAAAPRGPNPLEGGDE